MIKTKEAFTKLDAYGSINITKKELKEFIYENSINEREAIEKIKKLELAFLPRNWPDEVYIEFEEKYQNNSSDAFLYLRTWILEHAD